MPKTRLAVLALAPMALLAAAAPAAAAEHQIDIPAGPLDRALVQLATQTGQQLLYAPDVYQGRRAHGVQGRLSAEAALARLLADPAVSVTRAGPKVLVLRRSAPTTGVHPASEVQGEARPFVPEAAVKVSPPPLAAALSSPAPAAPPAHLLSEVVVTGSHIRGGETASPLVVLDREQIERTGRATVAEALQALPQTFGGESTEGTITTRADRVGSNSSYATSVNLRGLGADSTLVLVNGRRLAGSGNKGDFTDLSSIPMVAVDRVEVLLDGASATYGADAVGGVVNVILRRDFEGVEVRVRGGFATAGEPREASAGLVAGRSWSSGSALLAYEAYHRENLPAAARPFAASADLRPFGGSDRRESLAFPGNIVRPDPVTGATVPAYAIPPGQDGTNLRPSDFVLGAVNLSSPQQGADLLPEQRRQSLYLAARQEITPSLELSGDARYSFRRVVSNGLAPTSVLTVGRNNPFFVSPTGAASHQIQYSFQGELANPQARPTAESLSATLGARLELPADWAAETYAAFAQELIESRASGQVNTAFLAEALGNAADNPNTAYRAASDGYFNPFTGRPANPAQVLAFIGSGWTQTRSRTQVFTASAQADGPVWDLPGGELRLAVGLQARRETYRRGGTNFTSTVLPTPIALQESEREVTSAFLEIRAPIVSDDNARPLLRQLELSAALRAERYSDFGETLNPKAGLIWSPLDGLKLRATYGESFRAPALVELNENEIYVPLRFQVGSARLLTLSLNGGNPDLAPETATSITLGADLEPAAIPGLKLSATWFETEFSARIDRPVLANRATALVDPRLASFVRYLSPTNAADQARIRSYLESPRFSPAVGVFPASDYAAIVDIRYVNTGRLDVRGLDLQATYGTQAWGGRLTLAGSASWLLDYQQQLTPTADTAELAAIAGYPSDIRARISADWSRDSLSAGLSLNHLAGFDDPLGGEIESQTTLDGQLRLTGREGTAFDGTSLTLSVRNLLDAEPPFYDNIAGLGYDPASADPVGRFVSVQFARRW